MRRRVGVSLTAVAERGPPSSRLISPKKAPGCSDTYWPDATSTRTVPSRMRKNTSPGSPARVSTDPAGASQIRAMLATCRSCFGVHPSNIGTALKRDSSSRTAARERTGSNRCSPSYEPSIMRLISSMWPSCSGSIALATCVNEDSGQRRTAPGSDEPRRPIVMYMGTRGGSIRDATLRPSEDRQVPAQCSGQTGKVPETGKGTTRTEGRKRDPPRVLDRATPTQLVSAHGSDPSPTRPLGGSGMTCPGCQHKNLPTMKFCGECGTPLQRPQGDATPAPSYADVQRSLTEALEQQTATSEILRVISGSPTDVQPVFDAVAESAAWLCDSSDAEIFRRDGDRLLLVGHHGPIPSGALTVPLVRGTLNGRAVLDRCTVHVADLQRETDEFPQGVVFARQNNTRGHLVVPMLREGVAIGTISLRRVEARLFTARQVALLQTFADQAVIAIENVRLFTELQEKNRALTEAHAQVTESLEQQTATSEVLKVISRSTFDLQLVLDTLIENATKLCDAAQGNLYRFDGEVLRVEAFYGTSPEFRRFWQAGEFHPGRGSVVGRVALEHRTVQILDVLADEFQEASEAHRIAGVRTILAVPMLREGKLVGAIAMWRSEVRAFTERQIDLVTTFADQAVIAIENVRLFTELQTSNRELTTSLDTQTATSDILGVISRSPTDVQPVFDAILASAVRLLGAYSGLLTRVEGDQIVLAALTSTDNAGDAALRAVFPMSVQSGGVGNARVIRDRQPFNLAEPHRDPRLSETGRGAYRSRGSRSQAMVPLLRQDEAIGTIAVTRREPGGFSEEEIALLQTFADQAVIAIENVRLFTELEEKNRDLTEAL